MEFASVQTLALLGNISHFETAHHIRQRNAEEMFLIVELFQLHQVVFIAVLARRTLLISLDFPVPKSMVS
jgi:hypothetical protein